MRYTLAPYLDDIRSRLDIVQWIGRSLSLTKAGRNYKGLCPFHQEKTPSFTVNVERQMFYCFGCGSGGDLFTFVMKREGLSFPEAVRRCAEAAQVSLPEESTAPSKKNPDHVQKKRLLRLNQLACEFFCGELARAPEADAIKRYLKERNVSQETVTRYRLGYAPEGWQGLVNFLTARKAPLAEAAGLGLLREKQGRYWDFFRQRLIFPIIAPNGTILGFGGRRLSEEVTPKYLNSPESPIYHKGHVLYGLYWTQESVRNDKRVIIVEGYMDFLALAALGLPAVAPLGTALTDTQLRLLKHSAEEIILCFDSDSAGFQACLKSIALCLANEVYPRVLLLDSGEDPDSFVRKFGAAALHTKIAAVPTALDFMVDWLRQHPHEKPLQRQLLTLLLGIRDPIVQIRYLEKVASFFGVTVLELKQGFAEKKLHTTWQQAADTKPMVMSMEDKALISTLLRVRTLSEPALAMLGELTCAPEEEQTMISPIARSVVTHMLAHHAKMGELPRVHDMLDEDPTHERLAWISQIMVEENERVTVQIEEQDVEKLLKKITLLHLKNKLRTLTLSIEQAERQKNVGEMVALLQEKMKLLTTLKQD